MTQARPTTRSPQAFPPRVHACRGISLLSPPPRRETGRGDLPDHQPRCHPQQAFPIHPTSDIRYPISRHAFTIIELLVVISLMIILVGLSFPVLGKLVSSNKIDAGVNTVSVAAEVLRAYATQPKADLDLPPDSTPTPYTANYAGTALVFTQTDIRITYCKQDCKWSAAGKYLQRDLCYGYIDWPERNYISLPAGVGLVGIIGPTAGSRLRQPYSSTVANSGFAVKFDRYGRLIAGDPSDNTTKVYYDVDGNGSYNGTDALPTAIGVVVYSRSAAAAAGITDPASGTPQDLIDKAEGRLILFSRYAGTAMKD